MRAILEDIRSGEVAGHEVPSPELRPGGILVRTAFSAISAGTELAHREQVEKSLLGKALARPDLVQQVVDFARTAGVRAAYQRVQSRLDTLAPLGYSCAGAVIAVGQGVTEFRPGDRVACAGAGYASHCEVNFIPKNLAVRVPDSVSLEAAALSAIGAIALQGFRQSRAALGEVVAVIGAGLVGVLTIQLAKAAGCRVVALDLDRERAEHALQFGADLALCPQERDTAMRVKEFARYGADAAIITASSSSAEPIELAANISRDRGRIVVVGTVDLGVTRKTMYRKELSLVLSRSYGPGRYDPDYEEEGQDYPVGYVRWTEKRNMEAFLDLLAAGAINPTSLIGKRCPVEQGSAAYQELKSTGAYTVLLEYPARALITMPPPAVEPREASRIRQTGDLDLEIKIGCIGAGQFARDTIFPVLRKTRGVALYSVAAASGVASESARKFFSFARAVQPAELLQDKDNDAIFVLSRHDSHAQYVAAALANHKPVFVEKPLAVNRQQLDQVCAAYEAEREKGQSPFLMVGFNRRFAPMTEKLKQFFDGRREPMMVNVRVNAGYIPDDHWVQRSLSGGGRIVGEMCHFMDWSRFMVGVPVLSVTANALPDGARYHQDNLVATLAFEDGSIANIVYMANGDRSVPKENFEVFCEGRVGRIVDFSTLELSREGKTKRIKARRDKGHERELGLTLAAIRGGKGSPIPFRELVEVSEATMAVEEAISTGQPVTLRTK
ncbi:MAG TPA: bi-domain-containing oxidoreductase [Terriglobales bacterium]|nr:bi-domain-containing oxidoreductase [Terriglobales bacterium]